MDSVVLLHPEEEGLPRVVLAAKEVPLDNICSAALFVVILVLSQECSRATKLEQNVLAYISDYKRRLYEAGYRAKEKLNISVEKINAFSFGHKNDISPGDPAPFCNR